MHPYGTRRSINERGEEKVRELKTRKVKEWRGVLAEAAKLTRKGGQGKWTASVQISFCPSLPVSHIAASIVNPRGLGHVQSEHARAFQWGRRPQRRRDGSGAE